MEIGIYSFGRTPRGDPGRLGATGQALADLLEAVRLADQVGLDFFGVGEHHTRAMPLSAPGAFLLPPGLPPVRSASARP